MLKRKPKRLGSLGAGGHGESHFAVYEGVRLVAVYDPSPESVAKTRELVGRKVEVCKTADDLVKRDDLEAILIITPDEKHPDGLERVVQAGKPALCEKPLAIDEAGLVKVRRALELAQGKGLLVASCHPRRNQDDDLPYGWVRANLPLLEDRFGRLRRIGLNSIYPRPSAPWKLQRSFLLDKFVHDIDYIRYLLGDLPFVAERLVDSPDHYEVAGVMTGSAAQMVAFHCQGTRLHSAKGEFIETIVLNFADGDVMVYTKTGLVRLQSRDGGAPEEIQIAPMLPESYTRMFANLMREFVGALDGGYRPHSPQDLLVVTESAVKLAGPAGAYSYS